jgi:hypothetical protein
MQIVGTQGVGPGYPPNATASGNTATGNYVLAQASTKHLESDPNYRYGWRSAGTAPANGVR